MERQYLNVKEHPVNKCILINERSLSNSTTFSIRRIPQNQKAHTHAIPAQSSVHRAKGTHIISLNVRSCNYSGNTSDQGNMTELNAVKTLLELNFIEE